MFNFLKKIFKSNKFDSLPTVNRPKEIPSHFFSTIIYIDKVPPGWRQFFITSGLSWVESRLHPATAERAAHIHLIFYFSKKKTASQLVKEFEYFKFGLRSVISLSSELHYMVYSEVDAFDASFSDLSFYGCCPRQIFIDAFNKF